MGEEVETLADLLRPGLRAICIGINPSPVSVAAGHYYQGRLGQRFYSRLRSAGLLRDDSGGFEDDAAFAAGIGFTDIIKRPTASAKELRPEEFRHGRELLLSKLEENASGLAIFTFKKTAVELCGPIDGYGLLPGLKAGGVDAFVMPGPYERADRVNTALGELAGRMSS
jgi:TDG/mug DNA glycosylase family protein